MTLSPEFWTLQREVEAARRRLKAPTLSTCMAGGYITVVHAYPAAGGGHTFSNLTGPLQISAAIKFIKEMTP